MDVRGAEAMSAQALAALSRLVVKGLLSGRGLRSLPLLLAAAICGLPHLPPRIRRRR